MRRAGAASLRGWLLALVLVLALLATCWPYVAPGHPITYDAWPQLVRQMAVYQALKTGSNPLHSFMFYSGYPMLRFYGPLFHFLGGSLALVTGGDVLLALRILLALLQLSSGAAMFALLRRKTGTEGAVLGTLVYVLVPWRVRHVAALANYPMASFYVLLPLLFLVLDLVLERPDRRRVALLGLLAGLALLAHVVYGTLVVVLLLAVWAIQGRARRPASLALSLAGAAGVAGFFAIPFLAESGAHVYPKILMNIPGPDLFVALGLKTGTSGYSGGYLGLSVMFLVIAAIVLQALRARSALRRQAGWLVVIAASLAVTFGAGLLGPTARFLTLGLLPERLLLFFLFPAAVLVAGLPGCLRTGFRLSGRKYGLVLALIAVVLLADSLPHHLRIRYPQKEQFLGARTAIYGLIQSQHPTRTVDFSIPRDRIDDPARFQAYPAMAFLYGGLATPYGPQYHQFAPRSMAYTYPWLNQVARDLGDTTTRVLSERSMKALALLGVSHVIIEPPIIEVEQQGVLYDALLVKEGIGWDTRFAEGSWIPRLAFGTLRASLVLASNRLAPVEPESLVREGELYVADDWLALLDAIEVDVGRARTSLIPVPESQDAAVLPDEPELAVLESGSRNQDVKLKVRAGSDCYLRLAVSYYPWLRVRLDNRSVEFHETKDHFIWLECPAGNHELEVTAPLTPVRRWTLWLSALVLTACLGLILVPARWART